MLEMIVRIYLIVEEGADRVYVQSTFPAWYVKPESRRSEVYAVDVEVPDIRLADDRATGRIIASLGGKGLPLEQCSKCRRLRPGHIADPTCPFGGYCNWVKA
jgi:hypothetical protein